MKVTKNLFNLAEDYKFIGIIYLYLQIVFSVKIWSQVCYKALDILELTTANIFLPFICEPSFLLAFSFPFLPCICNSGFPPSLKKKKKKMMLLAIRLNILVKVPILTRCIIVSLHSLLVITIRE